MDKEILIGTTLREFNKNDNHYETQILFLESIKKQTYQNYRLIVTEFFEKNLKETLNKFNLKYTLIKSRKLEFLKNINAKFSHWEFMDNTFKFNIFNKNIIVSSLSDIIFEENFFEILNKNYKPNFSGTCWPQINYLNPKKYHLGHKKKLLSDSRLSHEFFDRLDKNMSDVYFLCGNNVIDENFKLLWKQLEHHGRASGIFAPLVYSFFNKNRYNLYFKSKISSITNYSIKDINLDDEKNTFYENDKKLMNFCDKFNINKKFLSKNTSFRKLRIFNSYKIFGKPYEIIILKFFIYFNFLRRILLSTISKISGNEL